MANDKITLPDIIKVKIIDAKSEDWVRYHYAWDQMYWLYSGGVLIEGVAEQFLKKRAKEMPDVYQTRVEQFRYQGHVGAATDWYQAALLEEPPRIQPYTDPSNADQDPQDMLDDDQKEFYDDFSGNCDRARTPFIEHIRQFFKNMIVYGRACSLIDLPHTDVQFATLAEEKAAGMEPYMVSYDPRQMINYSKDNEGVLNWVVFSARIHRNPNAFEKPQTVDCWYYFDRQQYAVYERQILADEKVTPDDAEAQLKDSGLHPFANTNKVPVIYCELPEGLWLMNRAFSAVKDHLNTDNVLGFALYMAALAMPVIKMDGEFQVTLSEAGFIKLPKDAEYSWAEPEGKSFEALAKRIQDLLEQIYRAYYLVAQARSNSATPAAQSGVSKQADMMPSKKIMNLFGDVIRQTIQLMYNMVSEARQDDVEWDVRGLDFPETPPNDMLDTIATAKALGVPSDSFERELNKMAVDATLPNANPNKKVQMYEEIDNAPTLEAQQQQALEQQANKIVGSKLGKQDFGAV